MYHQVNKKGKGKHSKVVEAASTFQPSQDVRDITVQVQKDMQTGRRILETTYTEFNDRTVLEEIDNNQKNFNSYVPPKSDDPDESWRAQTVRPITRNKLISIAAHVTASIIYPNIFAQNDRDDEDRDSAEVMRDLVEWVIENSQYSRRFLQAIIAALTDPVAIMHTGYAEVMRKVRDMKADGTYTEKEIIDEALSGFVFNLIQANELYIANAYEPDVQKQRFVARRKLVDYEESKQVNGDHENFKYVKPGVRHVFDEETNTFYEQQDEDMKGYMVEEVTYYNRSGDLQLTFVNGIIMCDPKYPNQRKDKKYPFAATGYEFLNNGNFFYYKSAANKLSSDQELIDTMYNMVMDGTFLSLMPPFALYGSEDVDSSVMTPGTITSFRDPNTKLESIAPRADVRGGMEAIGKIEQSMAESSQDNTRAGIADPGSQTAYEIKQLQENAAISLGMFGKMVGFFVKDIGDLIISDILQHLTVGDATDMLSPTDRMKFRTFLLPEKNVDGKKKTKKIQFTDEGFNKPDGYTQDELMANSFKIMDEGGGFDGNTSIYKVNPEIFRKIKFAISVEPDTFTPKNKNLEKALNLEAYDRLIQNPLADQQAVLRDFLVDVYKPGEGDKYIQKQAPAMNAAQGADAAAAAVPNQKGVNTNLISQMTGGTSSKKVMK